MSKPSIHAQEAYTALNIDTAKAIKQALAIPVSIHR